MPVTINGTTGITDADGGNVLSTADLASQAEAQAGTNNTKLMTPLRVAEAIQALASPAVLKQIMIESAAAAANQQFLNLDAYGGLDFYMAFVHQSTNGQVSLEYSTNNGSSWAGTTVLATALTVNQIVFSGSLDFATGKLISIGVSGAAATQFRTVTTVSGISLAANAIRFLSTSSAGPLLVGYIKPHGGTV